VIRFVMFSPFAGAGLLTCCPAFFLHFTHHVLVQNLLGLALNNCQPTLWLPISTKCIRSNHLCAKRGIKLVMNDFYSILIKRKGFCREILVLLSRDRFFYYNFLCLILDFLTSYQFYRAQRDASINI
jgi:hypothetical protein